MSAIHDIGWAIDQMRAGFKVRRAGWNGKGMYLLFVPASLGEVEGPNDDFSAHFSPGQQIHFQEHVLMWTVQSTLVPWLASQTDLLARDYELAS